MGNQNRVSRLKCINEFFLSKKYVLLGAMTGGLLAHGYTLTNKFSFHDDIGCTFELGGTLGLGRFTLWEIYIFMTKWVGGIYSMPWFNGVMSLIFLTLAAMLLVDMLTYQGGGGKTRVTS